MTKPASPSQGVGLAKMNDLLARLTTTASRLHRIRTVLSALQSTANADRVGLIIAQSPETVYWADRTEHPEPVKEENNERPRFQKLMSWAESQPVSVVSASKAQGIPSEYALSSLGILRDGQDLVGVLLLCGRGARLTLNEETEALLGLLTMVAIEQRTFNNLLKFLGEFAHDQRNSLNVVSMSSDLLSDLPSLNDRSQSYLTRIIDNVLQLGNQIENTLAVDRYDPETDEYHMLIEPVDLVELRREITDRYMQLAQRKKINLKVPSMRTAAIVNADRGMLTRAVTNLVDNALKFTPEGGTVEVSISRGKRTMQVVVRDTGPGIAPENVDRIFERKVRIRQGRNVRGLGLGLFIVRSVALKHGGKAWVESQVGSGSTFYLTLPKATRSQNNGTA